MTAKAAGILVLQAVLMALLPGPASADDEGPEIPGLTGPSGPTMPARPIARPRAVGVDSEASETQLDETNMGVKRLGPRESKPSRPLPVNARQSQTSTASPRNQAGDPRAMRREVPDQPQDPRRAPGAPQRLSPAQIEMLRSRAAGAAGQTRAPYGGERPNVMPARASDPNRSRLNSPGGQANYPPKSASPNGQPTSQYRQQPASQYGAAQQRPRYPSGQSPYGPNYGSQPRGY